MLQHEPPRQEPRYDAETLRKVTALAGQLQSRNQERLTAREIEEIGAEVGVEPQFIREALEQVTRSEEPVQREVDPVVNRHWLRTLRKAWWACGWALPMMLLMSMPRTDLAAGIFFSSWGIYAAVGIILGSLAKSPDEIVQDDRRERRRGRSQRRGGEGKETVSRAELLNVLGGIRVAVEVRQPERQALAAVCLEGVLPGEIPRGGSDRFDRWARETVERHGGELRPEAGLLATALFRDEVSAIRAARELCAAGDAPFPVRIGVAVEGEGEAPRQRARAFCRSAEPGDILVGQELADEAVLELDGVAALPGRIEGERVFSWRAAHGRDNA